MKMRIILVIFLAALAGYLSLSVAEAEDTPVVPSALEVISWCAQGDHPNLCAYINGVVDASLAIHHQLGQKSGVCVPVHLSRDDVVNNVSMWGAQPSQLPISQMATLPEWFNYGLTQLYPCPTLDV